MDGNGKFNVFLWSQCEHVYNDKPPEPKTIFPGFVEGKIQLPVDVRASKTSVLKFPNKRLHLTAKRCGVKKNGEKSNATQCKSFVKTAITSLFLSSIY